MNPPINISLFSNGDQMIEKFLFKKIEVWLAIALTALALTIVLGGVLFAIYNPKSYPGSLLISIKNIPNVIKDFRKGDLKITGFEVRNKFSSKNNLEGGFSFKKNASSADVKYIFNSRFDGDKKASVVEYTSIDNGKANVKWSYSFKPELAALINSQFKKSGSRNPIFIEPTFDESKMMSLRLQHPVISGDGGVVMKNHHGALLKINLCGEVEWVNTEFAFHHSTEIDNDGNIYVPGSLPSDNDMFDERVIDDHIVILNDKGRITFKKSIFDLLRENGLHNRVYTYDTPVKDPIHLNDIQPVNKSGPFWEKGDVFVSIGHLNMILLYRPKQNKLIWYTQDKLFHQHDIDLLSDHEISVFNNNRVTGFKPGSGPKGADYTFKHNEILIFNFKDNKFSNFKPELLEKYDVKTTSQGLADFSGDGGFLIEETNFGRLLYFGASGDLEWEFLNKDDGNQFYTQNWSRLIKEDSAQVINTKLDRLSCSVK